MNELKQEQMIKEFWENNAELSIAGFEDTYDIIISMLPLKDIKILDIGCGIGTLEEHLENKYNNITGMDISQNNVNICKTKFPYYDFIVFNVDSNSLPFKDSEFDIVICSQVLGHISNPVNTINEMLRVGKKCIIAVYNGFWGELKRKTYMEEHNRHNSPDFFWFTQTMIENILKQLGAEIEDIKYTYGRLKNLRKFYPRFFSSSLIISFTNNGNIK